MKRDYLEETEVAPRLLPSEEHPYTLVRWWDALIDWLRSWVA